ncbi:hypothetical protein [Longivirga aurantiaca]|uniref:Uncharacterized protein n=1 Tax=Longivirga aurantiaca TaxID=1837743 RepID=A0ABW1SXK1_9ACTN
MQAVDRSSSRGVHKLAPITPRIPLRVARLIERDHHREHDLVGGRVHGDRPFVLQGVRFHRTAAAARFITSSLRQACT